MMYLSARPLRAAMTLAASALLAAPFAARAQDAHPSVTAQSPDGSIVLTVSTDNDNRPTWSLSRKGKLLIAPSKLGFLLTDAIAMERGFSITGSQKASADTTWEQPWGERRYVRDHHNELLVHFKQSADWGGRLMNVRFRLFDNGIGFRYEIPTQPAMTTMNIADEITEFDLAPHGTAWWIPGGEWNRYEQIYQETPIDCVSTAHTPVTMKTDGGTYLSFHEAALVDYSGYWLKHVAGGLFRTTLAPSPDGPRVSRKLPFDTPWRTIRIADNAAGLVENSLELNLNEPNKEGDVSWFKSMKYVGIWWGMITGKWTWAEGPRHGATTARAIKTIDFAAKHHFGGVLVEGWNKGWNGNWFGHGDFSFTQAAPDFDLQKVTAYAKKKGVQLIGHNETGGNIANYEAQMDAAFRLYHSLGMNSVKTGYVADAGGIIAPGGKPGQVRMEWHDGQRNVEHHLKVIEEAAKYHIAIDSHEPVKDTGLRRTYPNWIDREGARGMEYNAGIAGAQNPPNHVPTLVYTRMLSGPMDFTPGVLSLEGKDGSPLNSTEARQLGLYIALYSPIQMAADFIDELAKYPKELDFISQVPATWSESHLIAGEVGEYAIFARKDRNGDDWYVGGVNDATARTLDLDFGFLEPGKTYTATIYRDGDGATYKTEARHRIAIETRTFRKGDSYKLWLASGGGAAIRLHPAK